MAFRELLKTVRTARGMSQGDLAERMGGTKDTVYRIETGASEATQAQVAAAAKALDAPELLVEHCDACPVATALLPVRYPTLDQVATHPAVVAHKLGEECGEAVAAAEALFGIFNRLGWQDEPEARERVAELLVEVRDVEVAIQILYRALFLGRMLPLEVLQSVQERHRRKCEERGYCKTSTGEGAAA